MKRPRSPRYSQRLDYEGDEAEASSQPSSSSPGVKNHGFLYDVFLSFRGPDTRKTFTGHLHQALKDKGIITFIDNEKLEKGQKVEEIFGYIQRSKIFVPIFSKGYADSEWCLKEITEIVECGRLIIPVFFHVEPRDVRRQIGPFESAFKGYHAKDFEQVNKWSDALTKAGEVSGYNLADTEGDEAELIRRIVKRLLTEVNKTRLFVTKHPVGLDSRIADVMEVLDIESHGDARIVGIYGMGGMGKTTIAKAVYNQISSHFEACSFLSNIRAAGLVSLQKQLLGDIFQDKDVDINCSDEGTGKIQERIGAKKVLLVLDDVDDQSQLDALVSSLDWFRSGSRIIITTRDKGVLREQRVNLYELEKLDAAQSLQLFSWHAFGKEKPDAKFTELSKEVASIASGLPLALKVFGPLFYGRKTDEEWENMLARLKAAQLKGIYETLKISYDVLEEEEKKVFLDIACFFVGQGRGHPAFMWKGEEREHAAFMWKACGVFPETTIEVLMSKCLVSINDRTGDFEMHDQIRDMGRKIVKDESPNLEPEMRSRLWKSDESLDVLQNKTGTEKIGAIQLNSGIFEERVYVEAESFITMSELRMLRLGEFVHLKGEFQHFPKKLKWLQWCIKGHLDSFPDGLHLENIVVLDLSNSLITQLWNPQGLESTKVFGKMKVLKLTSCGNLTICPDFTSMPRLQKLNLNGCSKMSELHPSIGLLKSLTHLDLTGCWSLKRLPQEIWQLSSLEELDLTNCYEITTLPSQMEDPKSLKPVLLGKLKVLNFTGCHNLIICPDFTSMPHLQKLIFLSCQKMSELHPSIGLLKSLIDLNLHYCLSLKELHPENWQLTSLEELDIQFCSEITTLPSQLGNCKSLARLSLEGCKSLMELPEAVCQLTSLKKLILFDCEQLEIIPDVSSLKGLQKLDLSYCNKIVNVLGIQELDKLEELVLSHCENLTRCPLFSSNMTHLRTLDFGGCARMTELDPSIGHLKSLTDLNLYNCKSLKELPQEVSQLTSLVSLNLTGCYQISALPESMRHLKQLKWLYLKRCSSLTEISECICSFLNLELLDASHCQHITVLPNWIEKLKSLVVLDLSWTAIEELPHSIVSLENLKRLSVSHCHRLKFLPWFPPSLTTPEARGCGKLEDVPGIKQMKLLRGLDLKGCRSLDDSFLERLQKANFQNLGDFSISGRRLFDGSSSYPQSPSFLLPKQFETGILYLHVDKSSLDNICSELDERNGLELVHKSIPSDEAIDSQPGRVVLIEITTGDAKFQFSALIGIQWHRTSEEEEYRKLPTATFGRDSELMKMATEGEFKGNGDARQRTMMTMRVSIDGCVLLHGDLFTYTDHRDHWLYPDPVEADDNFVIVKFG